MSKAKKVLLAIGGILLAIGLYIVAALDNDPNTNVSLADTAAKVKAGVADIKEAVSTGTTAVTGTALDSPELVK